MSLSATLFGRDSAIHRVTNILGLGIPGWLDKKFGAPETEGPRLSDLSVQTSTYGAEMPRIHGMVAIAGNLLWLENNKLKETVKKNKSGGKGGSASEPTKTYSYSATCAIAICAGPIAGIRRIWCADKLIYNAGSDDLETIIASNNAARGWTLYLGTDDQMPDSRYEADVGVGNASAFRGIAYIVFRDFKLKDYSNTLQAAQFKFEVVSAAPDLPACPVGTDLTEALPTHLGGGSQAKLCVGYESGSLITARITSGVLWRQHRTVEGVLLSEEPAQDLPVGSPYTPVFPSLNNPRSYYAQNGGRDNTVVVSNGTVCTVEAPSYQVAMCDIGERTYAAHGGHVRAFQSGSIVAEYESSPGAVGLFHCGLSTDGEYLYACFDGVLHEFDADLNLIKTWSGFTLFANSQGGVMPWPIRRRVLIGAWDSQASGIYTFNEDGTSSFSCAAGATVSFVKPDGLDIFYSAAKHYSEVLPIESNGVTLSDVVKAECALSGLIADADVDSAALTAQVRGYRVSGGSIRSALEPLQIAFPFDVIQSGYQIKFIPRGQSSVITIPYDDMGATSGKAPDEIFQQSREMDPQLPARTAVNYLDAGREYSASEQSSDRINTEAVNKRNVELAIVLNADEAAGIAEMLQWLPWLERTDAAFTLPPTYLPLEAGDVVTAITPQASYELHITEANYTQDGRVECRALPNRAALYTPNASGGEGVTPDGKIPLDGASIFVPLDIPTVDETIQDAPGFVGVLAGYNPGWPGGTVFRSPDAGQTWQGIQGYIGAPAMGYVAGTLPASDCTLIDERSISVRILGSTLSSITRDQMLAGAHYAAYGRDGRWEIVRYQDAELQGDGSYLLSGFVRGECGTEWATGLHAEGDVFVDLHDPDNAFIGMATATIEQPFTYRGVTAGAALDSAVDVPFTYRGVNLECLSPVYPAGTRSAGDLAVTWTRRSRLSSSWWATGVVAPVGEASEGYEVDVMDGSTAVRTITASTPTITYTSAQQSTDFGSPQASIALRIYQLSAVVGRGYPLEVTL